MKLYRVAPNEWIFIQHNTRATAGSIERVSVAMREAGISFDELMYGVEVMVRAEHNVGCWGDLNKTFLFSYDPKAVSPLVA